MHTTLRFSIFALLSFNAALLAMEQKPTGAEKPIDAFKKEIKELNPQSFNYLGMYLDGIEKSSSTHASSDTFTIHLSNALTSLCACHCLIKKDDAMFSKLIDTYCLPIYSNNSETEFHPLDKSCLHPIAMSIFSQKFQDLIQRRKTALINQKIEDGEEIEKWTVAEKQAFGVGLFNTEIKQIKAEFKEIYTKITPFNAAYIQIKQERENERLKGLLDILTGDPLIDMIILGRLLKVENGAEIHIFSNIKPFNNDNSSDESE